MNEQITQLEKRIVELEAYISNRKINQLSLPLDPISKDVLQQSSVSVMLASKLPLIGTGSYGQQTITIGAGGGSAFVPAQPTGTVKIQIGTRTYDIPYK